MNSVPFDFRKWVIAICHWVIRMIRVVTPESFWTKKPNHKTNKATEHQQKQQAINRYLSTMKQPQRYKHNTDIVCGNWQMPYLLNNWKKNGYIKDYDDEGLYISLQSPSPLLRTYESWRLSQRDPDDCYIIPELVVRRDSFDRWLKSLGYHGWDGRRSWEWSP